MAMKLARFEAGTKDGYRTLETVLPTYDSLKRAELRQIAAKYLQLDRASIVWAVPAEKTEAATRKSTPRKAKAAKSKKAAAKKPAAKKPAAKKPAAKKVTAKKRVKKSTAKTRNPGRKKS
jgi:hypothetical protein